MLELPCDLSGTMPGSWQPVYVGGKRSAVVRCPKCGRTAGLDHAIDGEGVVSPSLECPYAPCPFHDFVKLVGWAESLRGAGGGGDAEAQS